MKYSAPKAERVLFETESVMSFLLYSGDYLPDDDDTSAAPATPNVEWDG